VEMDISSLGDSLVKITLTGRLDTQGVDQIETRFVDSVVPGGKSAVVDLSAVEFVASMGIRLFVSTAQNLRKRRASLALYGAPRLVAQVFEAVSLHKILPVCATEAEALERVTVSPS